MVKIVSCKLIVKLDGINGEYYRTGHGRSFTEALTSLVNKRESYFSPDIKKAIYKFFTGKES